MTSPSTKRRYHPPHVMSVALPVYEELLAVGYRAQAERWARDARERRQASRRASS